MSKPAKHALTVLAAPALHVTKEKELAKLQAAAVAQLSAVSELEAKAAIGGVLAGLTLHRVKASMPHGTFGKWLESKTNGVRFSTRQAQFLMRLALVFLEKTRAQAPDLLALPGSDGDLALADNAAGKALAAKLQKFVGEASLYELLVKHGIRGVSRDGDDAEGGDDDGAGTAAGEDFFAEVATTLEGWRKIVTDKTALVRLTPKQLDLLKDDVSASYNQFLALYKETRGKA